MKGKKRILILSVIVVSLLIVQSTAIVSAIAPPGDRSKYYVNGTVIDEATGDEIWGATVKCYVDEIYKGLTTTGINGWFSFSVLLPFAPRNWMVEVSKSGYDTSYAWKSATNPTTSMGVIELSPDIPPMIDYDIHGNTHEWFSSSYSEPLEGATIDLFREVYEGWDNVDTTTSQSDGSFSFSYSSTDTITSFKVVATYGDLQEGTSTVSSSGTDFDMGDLYLAGDFYSITGTLFDDISNEEVPDATVEVYSTFSGAEHYLGNAMTNSDNGLFSFTFACSVVVTNIRIDIFRNGYDPERRTISSPSQTTALGNIVLNNIPQGYAVIVGITSYELEEQPEPAVEWCTNDALLWYDFLLSSTDPERVQFSEDTIWLLGDDEVSGPEWDGIATEVAVEQALNDMIEIADGNDIICFIVSTHGDYNHYQEELEYPTIDVAIKLFDYNDTGENTDGSVDNEVVGVLWDYELTGILESTTTEKIFVFLDCCSSGGFKDNFEALQVDEEVTDVYDRTLLITATNDYLGASRGYPSSIDDTNNDFPDHGLWTHLFLERGVMQELDLSFHPIVLDAYQWANVDENDPNDPDDDPNLTRYQEEYKAIHEFLQSIGKSHDADYSPSASDTPSITYGYLMPEFWFFSYVS